MKMLHLGQSQCIVSLHSYLEQKLDNRARWLSWERNSSHILWNSVFSFPINICHISKIKRSWNSHETPLRLALYPFSTTSKEALREAIEDVVPKWGINRCPYLPLVGLQLAFWSLGLVWFFKLLSWIFRSQFKYSDANLI